MAKVITYECTQCGCEITVNEAAETELMPIYCCGMEVSETAFPKKARASSKKTARSTGKKTAGKAAPKKTAARKATPKKAAGRTVQKKKKAAVRKSVKK
ncbi:MAG: hypothetical protein M0Z60_06940 [Nitrospiraceae bacterium]|nr:hypothetical protein [Nitrospiraceae bacterium]